LVKFDAVLYVEAIVAHLDKIDPREPFFCDKYKLFQPGVSYR
jgi:hypothetical protein